MMSGAEATRRDWLRVVLASGVGAGTLERLGIPFGEWCELPNRSVSALQSLGLTKAQAEALTGTDAERLEAAERWLDAENHHFLLRDDDFYPPLLRRIDDAPVGLFVVGAPETLLHPQVAIVGSRNATDNGLATARQLSGALASAGLVVRSGLAAGIDGAAHAAAIAAGGRTIAVAGTGPDRVYPARHRELAHRIVDNGAVVSSFAPGVGPRAAHFPARNRIISGMSAGVVVVEAGLRSGSLITARLAGEQGREVFAVPGSIRNPVARGCHRLIRQGARLVETAEDVFEDLRPLVEELAGELRVRLQAPSAAEGSEPGGGEAGAADDQETRRLLQAVGFDPTPIDEIIERTRLTTPAVSSMLLMLELEGRVTSHGGGRYSRTGNDLETN